MKRLIVLLVSLLLLCSCSTNKKPVAYGVVLQKDDQAVMCFIDEDNKVLYEMEGVSEELAREAFRLAAAKLPISTTFVARHIGA